MTKIAVASEGAMVAGHFGHCPNFNIFTIVDGKIAGQESIPNPGHTPGFLPNFLHGLGVTVVISGGMGAGAIEIFCERQIETIVGISGEAVAAVEAYLRGELASSGAVCREHMHHDQCGH